MFMMASGSMFGKSHWGDVLMFHRTSEPGVLELNFQCGFCKLVLKG